MLKQQMKRMVSLLCMVVMIMGVFTGCGNQDTSSKLYGTWEMKYDVTDYMKEGLGEAYADMDAKLVIKINFTFKKDGTYTMAPDEEAFNKDLATFLDSVKVVMVESVYQEMEAQEPEKTREEIDETMQEDTGMTVEEYVDAFVAQVFAGADASTLLADYKADGEYKAQGNKLYLIKSGQTFDMSKYKVFSVKDNKLIIDLAKGEENTENSAGLQYPLTMTKKSNK